LSLGIGIRREHSLGAAASVPRGPLTERLARAPSTAATGTGKTVIAALDYRDLVSRARRPLRLLFVAHREQILNQSCATFRAVLKDPSFGEILGGSHRPPDDRHLFATIQSLRRTDVEAIDPARLTL
jgi:superfamily II DNA or RNA helicase